MPRLIQPGESLADLHPDLCAQWHPTKNQGLAPADFKPSSRDKVWWICNNGHEWAAEIRPRATRGVGCPKCWNLRRGILRATPKPGQSFADLYPEIAQQWHPTRNELRPDEIRPASQKKVWWQCDMGHEWFTAPANRLRGEKCPECAVRLSAIKRSTPDPGESLADLYPHLAAEWHPTMNAPVLSSEVNPGSRAKRWWKCRHCGNEWQTTPAHRTVRNQGCAQCSMKRMGRKKSVPKPGESLAEKNPDLAAEWHPTLNELTPFDVRPRGRSFAWWRCKQGHEWRAKIAPRAVGIGCPQCSIIGVAEREVRLAHDLEAAGLPVCHNHPRITVGGRRPVQADIVAPAITLVIEYDGSYYHVDKADKDRKQTAELNKAGWTVLRVREAPLPFLGGNEVAVSATEPIKAVAAKVLKKLDRMGYQIMRLSEYLADPELWAERPANLALNKLRAKSLATEHPHIAKQFDLKANNGILPESVHPGSMTKYWWRCDTCDYLWEASVNQRLRRGCKKCGVRKRVKERQLPEPGHSFADLYPLIAREWHPNLNGDLLPSQLRPASNELVWWQCKRGHEWQAKIATRREFGRCRTCSKIDRTLRRDKTKKNGPQWGSVNSD